MQLPHVRVSQFAGGGAAAGSSRGAGAGAGSRMVRRVVLCT